MVWLLMTKRRGVTRSYFFATKEEFEVAKGLVIVTGEGTLHLPSDRAVVTLEEFKEIIYS